MDLLDWIVVLLVIAAAIHGLRLGAAVQILSFAGALGGLVIGVVLVSAITPHLHGEFTRSFVSLLLLLLPCGILWTIGRQIGAHLWGRMQGHSLRYLDSAAGAAIAMAGTLIFVWLLASMMVNSQVASISNQIENSTIIRGVSKMMPSVPTALVSVERLLGKDGFPLPVIEPGSVAPVKMPSSPLVAAAVRADGSSTVKVVSSGCDDGYVIDQGSGFAVSRDLVVTNAHVIAGGKHIVVTDQEGDYDAVPIEFDPEFDLAVLRVPGLDLRPLSIDPHYVTRGTDAAVLGYPRVGYSSPFNSQPAGVLALLDATGMDIYGNKLTTREIYEIQALVRQGNSGGPLVEPNGLVIGVVFSRATDNANLGYALASPSVLKRVQQAEHEPADERANTGSCLDS